MSGFGKISLRDLANSVILGVIIAALGFLSNVTDIFTIDWKALLNVVVLAVAGSLLKSLGTDSSGKFGGMI